jgi:hypothetical protein
MNNIGSDDSTNHFKSIEILIMLMTVLGGVLAVVAVEVPWIYFITRGGSQKRDHYTITFRSIRVHPVETVSTLRPVADHT